MQVKRFELSPAVQLQYMEDLVEQYQSDVEEGESRSFAESVQAFYDNEIDELHDSSGDAEYQEGVLERMQLIEDLFPWINKCSAEDKLSEAGWAKA